MYAKSRRLNWLMLPYADALEYAYVFVMIRVHNTYSHLCLGIVRDTNEFVVSVFTIC